MKKKGFTLIELLAVIVVLAIIALIATPIVMNTIKNSKKGATERGTENYIKQVETSLMTYRLENGENLPDGEYKINKDGNICLDSECQEILEIEMNGTKPNGGVITIKNNELEKESSFMFVENYRTTYDTTKKNFVADKLEVICTKDSGVDLTGLQYGDKFTCNVGDGEEKTFYVLEKSGNSVSLIMNMNIDLSGLGTTTRKTVAWCKNGSDNICVADGALEYLKTSTISWIKLDTSQISLPTAKQIATSSGQTFNNDYISELPTWLYENLNVDNALYAYWTSTPRVSYSSDAWSVCNDGKLHTSSVVSDGSYGIRPVITISKSQLG